MQGPHPSGRLRLCNAKAASSESGHRRFVSHTSMTHVIEVDDPQGAGKRDGGLGPPCPKVADPRDLLSKSKLGRLKLPHPK